MPITREFINGRISFSVRTPKRKGITTLAVKIPLFYKEGRKSLTTIGFFKKSGDIFFGATSHKRNLFCLPRQERFFLAFWAKYRANNRKTGFGAVNWLLRSSIFCFQRQKLPENTGVLFEFLCSIKKTKVFRR